MKHIQTPKFPSNVPPLNWSRLHQFWLVHQFGSLKWLWSMLSLKGETTYEGLSSMNGDGVWGMSGINKVATTFGFWGKTIRISWIGIGLKAIPMEH